MLKTLKSPLLWLVLGFGCLLGFIIPRNPPVVFAFIVGISLLILFCRFPQVGLYFFLVSALWERMVFTEQFAVTLTGGKMIGWLAFTGWLYNYLVTKKVVLHRTGQELALASFWFLCLISGFWAKDMAIFWRRMFTLTQVMMLFYLINTLITTKKELKTLLWVVLLCILLSNTIAIFQYIKDPEIRVVGIGRNPNYISPVTILGTCIIIFLNKHNVSAKLKLFFLIAIVVNLVSLILTFSRGAMVTLGLVVFYWLITEKKKGKALISLSVLAILFSLAAPERFFQRMSTLITSPPQDNPTIENRILEAKAAILMIQQNPISGVGFGNFPANYLTVVTPVVIEPRRAHNTYLEVTAELGIFGGLVFMWIIINTWKSYSRAEGQIRSEDWLSDAARFLKLGYLAYLIESLFMLSQLEKYLWMIIALGFVLEGIKMGIGKLDQDEPSSPLLGVKNRSEVY